MGLANDEGLVNLAMVFGGGIVGLFAGSFDQGTKRMDWKEFVRGLLLLPIALAPIFGIFNSTEINPLYAAFLAVPMGVCMRFFLRGNGDKAELQAVRKVERAEAAVEEAPEKARPLWELSSAPLELYFERNLSQIRSMFWITVGVLLVGFCLIAYGVSRAFQGATIQAATLTAASRVLTEFIIENNKIRSIYSAMFYPSPEEPVPYWPPYDGNWPLPASFATPPQPATK
jgi:hypothetical protein